jgi:hypothetical protein
MRATFQKFGIAAVTAIAVAAASIAFPSTASAGGRGGGHGDWHGGHGGRGWGGFGWGLGTGLLLGAATAPYYYGGYYGYGPRCYITHRWVWTDYGRRVWRQVQVCD